MIKALPVGLIRAFSGCGCPLNDLSLSGNETIFDLGSGAGIDSYLLSHQITTGIIVPLDLTPDMLFPLTGYSRHRPIHAVLGDIETLPFISNAANVVISNASFNLTVDKTASYGETFRILKKGGFVRMCELVLKDSLPREVVEDPLAYTTSLGGIITEEILYKTLKDVGFSNIRFESHLDFEYVTSILVKAIKK